MRIPINKYTKEFINELLISKNFPDFDSYKLFIHIFVCGFTSTYSEDDDELSYDCSYVPLPKDWLKENVPDSDWRRMVSAGLISCKEYQRPIGNRLGLCREFAITSDVMASVIEKDQYDMNNNNLVSSTGRDDFRAYKAGNNYYDESRNPLPDLIVSSMKAIKPMPFNPHTTNKHISSMILDEKLRNGDYFHCNLMLKSQVEGYHLPSYSVNPEDGYTSYFAGYAAKKTGRIFEQWGCQGMSRACRGVVLSGVPDVLNYDLRASQALGLLHQFNLAGIKCQWLEDYCFTDGFQQRLMGSIPKELWKTLLYCTFFGGRVSPKLDEMRFFDEQNQATIYLSAAKAVLRYARENNLTPGQVDDALAHFCTAIEPLREALATWKTYLITDYLAKPGVVTGSRRRVITNPCGMKLQINELVKVPGKAKLKSAISAHLLQGYESAYIHHLTALSAQYGFKVYSNQHDGLITNCEIPKEAHEKAKELSGLALAELEIKPLT